MSPENGILTMRDGRTFKLPAGLGIRNVSTDKVRVLKTPRARRRPKSMKVDKISNLNITAPLSQLTQHMAHVPVKDMEAWVNRSIDVRHTEVAQKGGKIARPMNSFMLYRSAYAERTKKWCSQNNHQVVSRVSGQSWPKEPPEIREKYELLALVERDNHQKAHPDYKFAPNKTQTPPRKKRPLDDEGSDADETGYQIPCDTSPIPHKIIKTSGMKSEYNSRDSTPFDYQDTFNPEPYHQNRWPVPVGRLMAPRPTAVTEQHHHGYYINAHGSFPSLMRSPVDLQPTPRQGGYVTNAGYSASTGLAGIPGNINQELLRPYGSNGATAAINTTNASHSNNTNNHHHHHHSNGHAVTRMDDSKLDPQLLSSHQAGIDMRSYSQLNLSNLCYPDPEMGSYMPIHSSMGTNGVSYEALTAGYSGMPPLEEGQQVWAQCDEDGMAIPEAGKDFDQWIHPPNHHQSVYGQQ